MLPSLPASPALTARLRTLECVLARSGEAILITDHDNRIVEINAEFTRLTGYTLDEVRGLDPRFLASGKHSAEEYREFWASLMRDDVWHGEMWDRAKDGKLYPKWMTVSVVRDEAGAIQNYVAHFTDISESAETAAKLAHMAHFDALTQLYNRAAIDSLLPQALNNAQRDGVQVAVMLIDLDRFKSVNDSLGHAVGDHLLKAVADRLRDSMRASDIVARLGGDEFVVVLPDIENALSVTGVASKLKRNLADCYHVSGHTLYATPSIGITLFPGDGPDATTLLKNAGPGDVPRQSAGKGQLPVLRRGHERRRQRTHAAGKRIAPSHRGRPPRCAARIPPLFPAPAARGQ